MQQNQVNMWLSMNAENFRQQDLFFVKNTLESMPDDCIMYLSGASFQKPSTIFIIAFFLGWERFFIGSIGLGILKIITIYGLGIWWLIDVITANSRAKKYNLKQFQQATAFFSGNANTVNSIPNTPGYPIPYNTNKSNSGKGCLIAGIIIVVIAAVLAGGYFFIKDSYWFYNLFHKNADVENLYKEDIQIVEQQTGIVDTATQEFENLPEDEPIFRSSTSSTNSFIPGRFPQASERLLTASELRNLSNEDLKIMRNEIFARHGYIFKTNDMRTYFQNQDWYTPQYSNVNSMLTNIEQQNIELIKRYE